MASDLFVYDTATAVESSPTVFLKKEWLNLQDSMNNSYSSNQSILETSSISNSGKYMSYREGFLLMPLLLTMTSTNSEFKPATNEIEYCMGLKNWFGNIIHAIQVELNGTSIVQNTNFVNMWNMFRLITSLSYNDVLTQGSSIGFYLDDPLSFSICNTPTGQGQGVCNNNNFTSYSTDNYPTNVGNFYNAGLPNEGFVKRTQYINYDPNAIMGTIIATNTYSSVLPASSCNNIWKSYIIKMKDADGTGTVAGQGVYQIAITAIIYLKHLHPFFSMCPLMKGVFFRMTMYLNNTTTTFTKGQYVSTTGADPVDYLIVNKVQNALGGVNPVMISSIWGGSNQLPLGTMNVNLSVGGFCLNNDMVNQYVMASPLSKSVYLYLPAYVFNPLFEKSYLSDPVKKIVYDDCYQYTVRNIQPNANFNNLLTNGIAGLKNLLIIPFYSEDGAGTTQYPVSTNNGTPVYITNNATTGLPLGMPVYASPFDPAGCGTTSPLAMLGNFNVVVSGENIIYNQLRYNFENFNEHLYGCNSLNAGMTDGMSSSLFNSLGFEMSYCYYYFNISRYLPIENLVAKSVQIQGTNMTQKSLNLFCFITYETSVSINVLTGSKV